MSARARLLRLGAEGLHGPGRLVLHPLQVRRVRGRGPPRLFREGAPRGAFAPPLPFPCRFEWSSLAYLVCLVWLCCFGGAVFVVLFCFGVFPCTRHASRWTSLSRGGGPHPLEIGIRSGRAPPTISRPLIRESGATNHPPPWRFSRSLLLQLADPRAGCLPDLPREREMDASERFRAITVMSDFGTEETSRERHRVYRKECLSNSIFFADLRKIPEGDVALLLVWIGFPCVTPTPTHLLAATQDRTWDPQIQRPAATRLQRRSVPANVVVTIRFCCPGSLRRHTPKRNEAIEIPMEKSIKFTTPFAATTSLMLRTWEASVARFAAACGQKACPQGGLHGAGGKRVGRLHPQGRSGIRTAGGRFGGSNTHRRF